MRISIQGFKGLDDADSWIELRPLTLLTGKNSSGKSTLLHFIEFIRLFPWREGFEKLLSFQVNIGNEKFGGSSNVLSSNKSEIITFKVEFCPPFLLKKCIFNTTFSIKDDLAKINEFALSIAGEKNPLITWSAPGVISSNLIDLLSRYNESVDFYNDLLLYDSYEFWEDEKHYSSEEFKHTVDNIAHGLVDRVNAIEGISEFLKWYKLYTDGPIETDIKFSSINDMLFSLCYSRSEGSIFSVISSFTDRLAFPQKCAPEVLDLSMIEYANLIQEFKQYDDFQSAYDQLVSIVPEDILHQRLRTLINDHFKSFYSHIGHGIDAQMSAAMKGRLWINKIFGKEEIEAIGDDDYSEICTQIEQVYTEYIDRNRTNSAEFLTIFSFIIEFGISRLFGSLTNVSYIDSKAIDKRRHYNLYEEGIVNSFLKYFSKLNDVDRINILKMLSQWLKYFDIADEVDILIEENIGFIYLVKGNDRYNIINEGSGVIKAMGIVMGVIAIMPNSLVKPIVGYENTGGKDISNAKVSHEMLEFANQIIIVEEPETNLHPALQSKVIDFLLLVASSARLILIVETHSEYIIRRLQVLSARGLANIEGIRIIYFENQRQSDRWRLTKKDIDIQSDGYLTDEFGPGFLDESSNQVIDLYRISRNQKN